MCCVPLRNIAYWKATGGVIKTIKTTSANKVNRLGFNILAFAKSTKVCISVPKRVDVTNSKETNMIICAPPLVQSLLCNHHQMRGVPRSNPLLICHVRYAFPFTFRFSIHPWQPGSYGSIVNVSHPITHQWDIEHI